MTSTCHTPLGVRFEQQVRHNENRQAAVLEARRRVWLERADLRNIRFHLLHGQLLRFHDAPVPAGCDILQMVEQDGVQLRVLPPFVERLQDKAFRRRSRADAGRLHAVQPGQAPLHGVQGRAEDFGQFPDAFREQARARLKKADHLAENMLFLSGGATRQLAFQKLQDVPVLVRHPFNRAAAVVLLLHGGTELAAERHGLFQIKYRVFHLFFFEQFVQLCAAHRQRAERLNLKLR